MFFYILTGDSTRELLIVVSKNGFTGKYIFPDDKYLCKTLLSVERAHRLEKFGIDFYIETLAESILLAFKHNSNNSTALYSDVLPREWEGRQFGIVIFKIPEGL